MSKELPPTSTPQDSTPDRQPDESALKRNWRVFSSVLEATGIFHPSQWPVKRLLRWAVVAAIVLGAVIVLPKGITRIRENEVGVAVHDWSGEIELKERVGYHIFLPYLTSFYVLDKTIHRLDLSWSAQADSTGSRPAGGAGHDIKLKTADGSDVSLDVLIHFKLVPQQAATVLRQSGTGSRFADVWIEPFVRNACFTYFGRLTTEQMYDANRRNEQAGAALRQLNADLVAHGIEVIALIPGEFRFYREYEQVIQEKKLADQQVEEQQSQARALLQDQERQLVEARYRGESRLATIQGSNTNRLIQARAEAEKKRLDADGYFAARNFEADGAFHAAANQAKGRAAALASEAAGLDQRRVAMAGEGGANLVGMEYARRLETVRFSGTPITREPRVQQFSIQPGGSTSGATASTPTTTAPAANTTMPPMSAVPAMLMPQGDKR